MKKIIVFTLIVISLSACKKVCYNCFDATGNGKGEKCFVTKNDMEVYQTAQYGLPYYQQCK